MQYSDKPFLFADRPPSFILLRVGFGCNAVEILQPILECGHVLFFFSASKNTNGLTCEIFFAFRGGSDRMQMFGVAGKFESELDWLDQ